MSRTDTRRRLILSLCILTVAWVSLHVGIRFYPPGTVWQALVGDASSTAGIIVATVRVPSSLLAIVVGAALGISGLVLQSVVRNPVAEPGLIGVNAGAALFVVCAVALFGVGDLTQLAAIASLGAFVAVSAVFLLVLSIGPNASTTTTLLAGVTVSALLAAGTQTVIILNEASLEELMFWLAGSFATRSVEEAMLLLVVVAPVTLLLFLWAPVLDVLTTDADTATALGVRVHRARLGFIALVAVLAGASVALCGPIAFVGLVAPHLARMLGERAHRGLIIDTALIGALLALVSDVLSRFVIFPTPAPVGTVMAVIGVPFLVYLLRK
ncbi:MAG: iron ABC transporter permease [Pseudomonadota bacterium]